MLKKMLANLEGLDAAIAALYTQKPDGKFHLNVEDDDGEELKRAKAHEVGLRQIAEQERDAVRAELATAKTQITTLQNDAGKDKNTLREQLEADYQKREKDLKDAHENEVVGLRSSLKESHVDGVAKGIAQKIALNEGAAELLQENIARRLQVEIVDGRAVTRVLSVDGKASTMTPDELEREYLQNKKFEGIIRGNDASGGGANGGKGGSGASKKLADMGDAERTAWATRDPDGFNRAVAAEQAAKSII